MTVDVPRSAARRRAPPPLAVEPCARERGLVARARPRRAVRGLRLGPERSPSGLGPRPPGRLAPTRLDRPTPVQAVRWSVDGEWLAVQVAPGGSPRTQVWVTGTLGNDLRQLHGPPGGASYLGPWTHERGVLATSHMMPPPAEGFVRLDDVATGDQLTLAAGGLPIVLNLDRLNRVALVRRGPRGKPDRLGGGPAFGRRGAAPARRPPRARRISAGSPPTDGGPSCAATPGERCTLSSPSDWRASAPERAVVVAERDDGDLEHVDLTADGRTAVLAWNVSGESVCELFDLETNECVALALPEPVAHDASFSRDGRWLAMTLEGPTHPRAVWMFDTSARSWQRITHQQLSVVRARGPADARAAARRRRHGLDRMALPGHVDRGPAAGPAVLYLHGGPEGRSARLQPSLPGARRARHRRLRGKRPRIVGLRAVVRRGRSAGRSAGGPLTTSRLRPPPRVDRRRGARSHRLWGPIVRRLPDPRRARLPSGPLRRGVDICGMADFHTFYAHTEPWIAEAAIRNTVIQCTTGAPALSLSDSPVRRAARANPGGPRGQRLQRAIGRSAPSGRRLRDARGVSVDSCSSRARATDCPPRQPRTFVRTTVDWLVARLL